MTFETVLDRRVDSPTPMRIDPGFCALKIAQGVSASSRGHTYSCPKCCFDRAACRDEGLVRRLGGRNVATCPFGASLRFALPTFKLSAVYAIYE